MKQGEQLVYGGSCMLWCRWEQPWGVLPNQVELYASIHTNLDLDLPLEARIWDRVTSRLERLGWLGGSRLTRIVGNDQVTRLVASESQSILAKVTGAPLASFRVGTRDDWDAWGMAAEPVSGLIPQATWWRNAPWDDRSLYTESAERYLRDAALRIRDRWREAESIAYGKKPLAQPRLFEVRPPRPQPLTSEEIDARFDGDAVLRARALAGAAQHALLGSRIVAQDATCEQSVRQLLHACHGGDLAGLWMPMKDVWDRAQPILIAEHNDSYLPWWQIHVTSLLLASGRAVWELALQEKIIASEDVNYQMAGWPRRRGSETGRQRREIIQRARELAALSDRGTASYDATALLGI
jgi:hypothetical protein